MLNTDDIIRMARVCEAQYPYSVMHTDQRAATNCAAAIRARGNK